MMAKSILSRAAAVLAGGAFVLVAGTATAEIQKTSLKVVGTWANLTNYYDYEKPFYNERLGKASGGKVKAQINPITELGLKGWEVMRLLKLGVFDVSHGVYGYVASEDPTLEGVDLSSVSKDFAESRKVVEAYEPVLRPRARPDHPRGSRAPHDVSLGGPPGDHRSRPHRPRSGGRPRRVRSRHGRV